MTFIGGSAEPYELQLAKGSIAGQRGVNKFGRHTDVDASPHDVWDLVSQPLWVAPTAAVVHNITSTSANDTSAGTGAQTLTIWGLTSWSATETSESITMNGTSDVTTAAYVIIHRMKVTASGASGPNVGDITATTNDGAATITAQINVGEGQTQMAIYGLGAEDAYVTGYYASAIKGAAGISAKVELFVAEFPDVEETVFLIKHTQGLAADGATYLQQSFNPYFKITGPAIIKIQVEGSNVNIDMDAGFDLIVIDQ